MSTPSGTGLRRSQPAWWPGAPFASGVFKPWAVLSIGAKDGLPSEDERRSCVGPPRMAWRNFFPPPYSARSRVHEYGGGEFLVAGGALYFVNDADQDVYAANLSGAAQPSIRRITIIADTRFADFSWDATRNRLIAVGETHHPAKAPPQNALWSVLTGEATEGACIALQGRDFYASPRISPDGRRLAFLAWDLPDMPWDAAQLFVAYIAEDGSLSKPVPVAGGNGSACFQPEWSGDGALYFVWDAAGRGDLYRWREGGQAEQITRLEGDLSMPLWNFHAASYALLPGGKVYLSFVDRGETRSAILDLGTSASEPHENGLTTATTLSAGAAGVALAGLTDEEPLCVFLDENPARAPQIIRRSGALDIDRAFVSRPTRIAIPSGKGEVFGLLYPPANPGEGTGLEEAAAHHQPARRPHDCGGARTEAANVVFHLARFLMARSRLFRQHRLWAGLPRPAEGRVGRRRC